MLLKTIGDGFIVGTQQVQNIIQSINIRRNQVNFLAYGQDSKKIESVGQQNDNHI